MVDKVFGKRTKEKGKNVAEGSSQFVTTYTEELGIKICELLAGIGTPDDRPISLRAVARMDGMPGPNVIRKWTLDYPDFGIMYRTARDVALDYMADDVVEIADGTDIPAPYVDNSGILVVPEYDVQKTRTRIDARKWYLAKLAPKRYGEKVVQEHTGPGGAPLPAAPRPMFMIKFGNGIVEYTSKQPPEVTDEPDVPPSDG